MKGSFFKRYQFIMLLFLFGCIFFTVTKRWDAYVRPVRNLGEGIQAFLGVDLFQERRNPAENPDVSRDEGEGNGQTGGADFAGESGAGEWDGAEADANPPEDAWENGEERAIKEDVGFQTVDESYFDDALFIGDSRIVGLRDYGKLSDHATFYASEGLNVFHLLSAKIVEVPGQRKKISVEEALGQRQFGKIYLMVGINELDIGTVERFANTYRETVDRIKELQPDAIIYMQSIMLVTQKRAEKGDYVTNAGIQERNEAIQNLADGETVFYLDVNEAITDETGGMNPLYTTDGVHLKAKYVPLWTEWLKTHVMK